MHIPSPDELSDEEWVEAFRQYEYLFENNFLPIQKKKQQ